jgi:hypothetical protein
VRAGSIVWSKAAEALSTAPSKGVTFVGYRCEESAARSGTAGVMSAAEDFARAESSISAAAYKTMTTTSQRSHVRGNERTT